MADCRNLPVQHLVNQEERKALERVAKAHDMTISQILRKLVKDEDAKCQEGKNRGKR